MQSRSFFVSFTKRIARATGHPAAFALATSIVILWGLTGPLFGFSDTWQLAINTSTTIVTFLMVFLIQSSQNRDAEAVQIKLDELIRASRGAHNALLDLEELDDQHLESIRAGYVEIARRARDGIARGERDDDVPDVR